MIPINDSFNCLECGAKDFDYTTDGKYCRSCGTKHIWIIKNEELILKANKPE